MAGGVIRGRVGAYSRGSAHRTAIAGGRPARSSDETLAVAGGYGCTVPRRRDTRRFGPGPYVLGLRRLEYPDVFPFTVPAVAQIEHIRLNERVTLLAGENGSGKSTILEAIAAAIGFTEQGGEFSRLGDLPAVPRDVLDKHKTPLLAPVLSDVKPRNGYFLRAESFFNVAQFIDSGDRFAPDRSIYGDVPLHAQVGDDPLQLRFSASSSFNASHRRPSSRRTGCANGDTWPPTPPGASKPPAAPSPRQAAGRPPSACDRPAPVCACVATCDCSFDPFSRIIEALTAGGPNPRGPARVLRLREVR